MKQNSPSFRAPAKPRLLDIGLIRIDGGTQSRAELDEVVVQTYAEDIAEGAIFPPLVVFHDGEVHWLADGFHRHKAHVQAGKKKVQVDVRQGTRRDAILYSVGANADHGLRRTNDDKRRAVLTLLNDPEWVKWSDREIARQCAVSHEFVRRLRPITVNVDSERTYATRHGTVAQMNTAPIGISSPDRQAEEPPTSPSVSREEFRASLPQAIKDREQAHAEWRARSKTGREAEAALDRVAELEEAVRSLEAEVEQLRAENKLYGEMKVQFEQGGFEKVIAGKDEEIRVLKTRVERESADKVSWKRAADRWKAEAAKLGFTRDVMIDLASGEIVDG